MHVIFQFKKIDNTNFKYRFSIIAQNIATFQCIDIILHPY